MILKVKNVIAAHDNIYSVPIRDSLMIQSSTFVKLDVAGSDTIKNSC